MANISESAYVSLSSSPIFPKPWYGNLTSILKNTQGIPIISIGPHCINYSGNFMICLLLIILSLFVILVSMFLQSSQVIFLYVTIPLHSIVLISYLFTALQNPGIVVHSAETLLRSDIYNSKV